MTPGARVAAAIGVLDAWLAGDPAEHALTAWARGARYAGSKDRAAVRDHVYDVLRRKGSCAALGGEAGETGRSLMLGLLRLRGQAPEALFTGEGHAPAPLTVAEQVAPTEEPDPWRDIPGWLHPALRADLGPRADAIIAAMQDRAPLYLRVNGRKATVGQVEESLSSDGIKTKKTDHLTALEVVENPRRLRQSAAYQAGLVEIQDMSVQMACAAVDWPGGGTDGSSISACRRGTRQDAGHRAIRSGRAGRAGRAPRLHDLLAPAGRERGIEDTLLAATGGWFGRGAIPR